MPKHPHAAEPGHRRDHWVKFRVSERDYCRVLDRSKKSGARTLSAYLRATALTGTQIELPPWETLRDLRNQMIGLTSAISQMEPSQIRTKALEAAIIAFDRISRL
jgi:Mobilization protein NikA